ncbi:phosphonate C-P lyase system protein PhnH [Sporosarcina sp. NPDC096371]|uniref:phosphonate C-P lyase system protein PhnH n=1 Tax=Sporosarcina sp. NPDC096371 TaxID=3364530 RepID=UPI003828B36A
MVIDVVHDTQEVFRTILHCMSRPGTIKNIGEIGEQHGQQEACRDSTFLSAMTLLDAEVSFHVVGENTAPIEAYLSAHTLAKVAELQVADYLFIMNNASALDISEAFHQSKKGTLTNPQQSATIIIETEKLSNEPGLALQGPGIETSETVHITASQVWMGERAKANQEYPLGVDMIVIDQQSNLMCLPRTTMIRDCEVS